MGNGQLCSARKELMNCTAEKYTVLRAKGALLQPEICLHVLV